MDSPTEVGRHDRNEVVAGLRLSGLARTKPLVVERLLNRFVGVPVSDIDVEEIKTVLLGTGLFADITVSLEYPDPARPLIAVSVEEKRALFPIPIFAATSDGLIGGLALINANAFGLNDKAIAVGLFQNEGWVGVFNYVKTPPDIDSFGWMVTLTSSRTNTQIVDERDEAVLSYRGGTFDTGFELRRNVGRFFSTSAGLGFRERAVDDEAPGAARVVPVSLGVSVRDTTWDGVFLSETSLSAEATYSFGLIGDGYPSIEGRLVYERSIFYGLRVVINSGAATAADAPAVFYDGPASAAVVILPSDFRSPSLGGLSIGFETRLFGFKAGIVSALAAYQAAIADGGLTGNVFAQGPAFGLRLYLAKLAIPAVDMGAAYNTETGLWRGAFGIGMRF